jgi:hypothetical protein
VVNDAGRHDGADTAYRLNVNEAFLPDRLLRSQIVRKSKGQTDAEPHCPGQCPQISGTRGGRPRG